MEGFGNVPIDTFNKRFCVVCAQRECVRSGSNNSSFDVRARTWKTTLFDAVPRADDSDPGFEHIRAKRFLPVSGHVQTVQFHPTGPGDVIHIPEVVTRQDRGPSTGLVTPAPRTRAAAPPEAENTEFEQGSMLDGSTPEPGAKASTGSEVILESGGSFTFGDDE